MRRSLPVRASFSILLALAGLASLAPPAEAQEIDHSFVVTFEPGGNPRGRVFDDEVMQRLRDRLGGIATTIQVVTSTCSSEYFAREGSRLNGDWSSAASRGARICETNTEVNAEVYQERTGIRLRPGWGNFGWAPQYVRGIQTDRTDPAQRLFDFAGANDHMEGGRPRFASGGNGAGATLRAMNAKSVAAVFVESGVTDMIRTIREVLTGAGYGNNEIDLAFNNGNRNLGFTVDRVASRDELLGANGTIEQMRTRLNGAAETDRRAFLLLLGSRRDPEPGGARSSHADARSGPADRHRRAAARPLRDRRLRAHRARVRGRLLPRPEARVRAFGGLASRRPAHHPVRRLDGQGPGLDRRRVRRGADARLRQLRGLLRPRDRARDLGRAPGERRVLRRLGGDPLRPAAGRRGRGRVLRGLRERLEPQLGRRPLDRGAPDRPGAQAALPGRLRRRRRLGRGRPVPVLRGLRDRRRGLERRRDDGRERPARLLEGFLARLLRTKTGAEPRGLAPGRLRIFTTSALRLDLGL